MYLHLVDFYGKLVGKSNWWFQSPVKNISQNRNLGNPPPRNIYPSHASYGYYYGNTPIGCHPDGRPAVPPVVARRFVPLVYPSLRLLPSKIHHVQSICCMKPCILLEKNLVVTLKYPCDNDIKWKKQTHGFIYFDLFLWGLENDNSLFQSWRVYVIGAQTPPSRPRSLI